MKPNENLKLDISQRSNQNEHQFNSNQRVTHRPSKEKVTFDGKLVKKKKKRRDKSDLGDNFIAPDGGWGWLVAVAAGFSTLVTFAVGQQFGIIFREHMLTLGISTSQLTSIINTQIAVSAFTGLLNGPLFRRFTYRQVAVCGSILTFCGLFLSVFANSFILYVGAFSCLYGFGRGINVSASSLAVNTYFKVKRRTATAYLFGTAGLGPIFLPYLATYLMHELGVQGTVAIFAALSLNTVACSLIYQPVKWHVKKIDDDQEAAKKSLRSSEEYIDTMVEPETPTLARANDGWFGSKASLNSASNRNRLNSWDIQYENVNKMQELRALTKQRTLSSSHSIKEEDEDIDEDEVDNLEQEKKMHVLNNENNNNNNNSNKKTAPPSNETSHLRSNDNDDIDFEERKKLPFYKKVIIFFDLDLLRDISYLNLAVGLTLINFVEINFAILTPFILHDFGFKSGEIALAMSSLGFTDLVVRFLVPVITAKINLSNQTFFIIGILGMCIGRTFLSFTRDFYPMIGIFLFLGLNKAFRTVFWGLIIPGYVPLKRLPAAAGLQLLMSGIFSMACGPLIGLLRDNTNYAFTLNFLNALCLCAISLWILESIVRKKRQTKSDN